MNIVACDPPVGTRRQYGELITTLIANPGVWLSVSPEDVAGKDLKQKQCSMRQAAHCAGLKVETAGRSEGLYIRLKEAVSR